MANQTAAMPKSNALRVAKNITVGRSPEDVYRFWRNVENWPRFMEHLRGATLFPSGQAGWIAKNDDGSFLDWSAEIFDEKFGQWIAWRSLDQSDLEHSGAVNFEPAPGDRGTVVRLEIRFNLSGGTIGTAINKLLGTNPEKQTAEDLRRFKQLIETGEIIIVEGQPKGGIT